MVDRLVTLAVKTADLAGHHTAVTMTGSIASSIISMLQSAQDVASTLTALLTSFTGLVLAAMALRGAFKKKD